MKYILNVFFYLNVNTHHFENHLHGCPANDPRLFLVESFKSLLQGLDLFQGQSCDLLRKLSKHMKT